MTGLQDILPFKLDLWMSSVQKLRQLAQLHMTTMTTMIAQCCFLANNPLEAPAHWHASNWQLWKSPWGREVDFFRRKCLPLGLRIDLTLILMAPKNGHEFLYFPPAGTHKVHTSKKGRMTETCWPGLDELWIIMMNLAAGPVCASKVVSQNHRSNARAQSLMSETAMLVTATWGMGWREGTGASVKSVALSSWKQETHPERKIKHATIEYRLVYRFGVSFPFFRVLGTGKINPILVHKGTLPRACVARQALQRPGVKTFQNHQ